MPMLDIYMDFGALHVSPTHPHDTIKKYGVCIKYSLSFHEGIPKETVSCPCNQFFPEFSCVSGKKIAVLVSATLSHTGFIPVSKSACIVLMIIFKENAS